MSLKARIYIAFILSLGAAALARGVIEWSVPDIAPFLWYLVLAVPASCLKVSLPGIRMGTMSVLFIFLLGGIVHLNLSETLFLGVVSVIAQSLWHSRFGVRLVQAAFSVATIAIAISATDFGYHAVPVNFPPFRLAIAVSIFFVANTLPIAIVVSLTEGKPLRHVWASCYLWCFPYFLIGAGVVSAFAPSHGVIDWQVTLVCVPLIYIIYRCYQLYLNRLEIERQRAEAEHKHAAEMAALHQKTVAALDSAVTANARLDAVFRATPLAIVSLDASGYVTDWNVMAEQIFGWSTEEVIGQIPPFAIGRSEDIVQEVISRSLRGETVSGLEMQQWRKDGSAFEASIWTAALPRADGENGIIITVADVSIRRRLEEQLRLSQKLEAVGRLAGGVAHDFNNLLTVINGYGSMLMETVSGHAYARSQAEEIVAAGTRAAELVSQLLTFSRRQMIKPRDFDVNQFVRDVKRMLKRVIGEHIDLRDYLDPDAGWIHADLNQMEGVLLNLATNARDAMPEGGLLTIESAPVDITPDQPGIEMGLPPGEYVRLIIRDTGHGMSAETKQRLFEPFYTTKERGRGTGLGLASVLGGVEQNRGRIFVKSELGKGSAFFVYLPRVAAPESTSEIAAARALPHARGVETILLVEDEVAVRRMLREALVKVGYRVWEARDGAEAIELWASQVEDIDLLVTDIVMPRMNGLRLIAEIRKLRPEIAALCMSGHSDDLIGRQKLDTDHELLRKPFLPELLVHKVREMLDSAGPRGLIAASPKRIHA